MLETPHVVVAAAIAAKIPNPLISIPLAFASHFILEKVPHWNPHLNTEKKKYGEITKQSKVVVVVDTVTSLVLGGYIAYQALPNTSHAIVILAASLISALPDLIEAPYYFLNMKNEFIEKKWIPFKKSIQTDTSLLPGLATQVITILAAFWWVFN